MAVGSNAVGVVVCVVLVVLVDLSSPCASSVVHIVSQLVSWLVGFVVSGFIIVFNAWALLDFLQLLLSLSQLSSGYHGCLHGC